MSPSAHNPQTIEILLIEDNPGDAELARQAMKDSKIQNHLHHVEDGDAAMQFLRRQPPYEDAPRPGLILLDLNLPGKDGREVLEEIKTDDSLKLIPVVILTTSSSDADILKSYQLHANCFITKPLDFKQFIAVTQSIENFWLSIVLLPPKS